jgi:CubicO group peptidase (beta-lactamase class C family)
LQTVKKEGEHGGAFAYKTVNSDALGWVIRRVTGKTVGENLSERIWTKLGMEQDAYFSVDSAGTEFAGGGLNTGLRDLARFGEMMRNGGPRERRSRSSRPPSSTTSARAATARPFRRELSAAAGLELSQHVVGDEQRERRVRRARRAWQAI